MGQGLSNLHLVPGRDWKSRCCDCRAGFRYWRSTRCTRSFQFRYYMAYPAELRARRCGLDSGATGNERYMDQLGRRRLNRFSAMDITKTFTLG